MATNADLEAWLPKLDISSFELLVGMLLVREMFAVTQTPSNTVVRGPDYEAIDPSGRPAVVHIRHFRRSNRLEAAAVDQLVSETTLTRKQHPNAYGLLITSNKLTRSAIEKATIGQVAVWDKDQVIALLQKNPDIVATVQAAQLAQDKTWKLIEGLKSSVVTQSDSAKVAEELKSLSPGRDHWREFEKPGTRILADIFSPHLGPPEEQQRSDDGLDIRDAIYPVRGNAPPWSLLRAEHKSRFVVAEFKNYVEPIGQRQVESIAQYLWHKAFRSFGLLVSRKGHDNSAMLARRRAWIQQDQMIVLLSDEDLVYMAQLKEEGQEPFQVIDVQLEGFFSKLTP